MKADSLISQKPWRRGIGNECHQVFDGQGSTVAREVGTRDGQLIAAAPALYDALKDLVAICTVHVPDHNLAIERAQKAIADAEHPFGPIR